MLPVVTFVEMTEAFGGPKAYAAIIAVLVSAVMALFAILLRAKEAHLKDSVQNAVLAEKIVTVLAATSAASDRAVAALNESNLLMRSLLNRQEAQPRRRTNTTQEPTP